VIFINHIFSSYIWKPYSNKTFSSNESYTIVLNPAVEETQPFCCLC